MDSARGVTAFAVAASDPIASSAQATVPIAILGTDAVLAAAPATPVQLAHACMRAGFTNVIPASWGDELIAAAVLRRLPQFGSGPAVQCSCPIVAHRLLTAGGDLRPVLLPLVSPPVAVARYVRTLARPARARITYVGACPGAVDESIDIRMSPDALIAMLAERDIVVADQPAVFDSVLPPDRRRFRSQPGGVPTTEALWTEFGSRTLVELDGDDFVTDLAQHLLTGKNVLIDAGPRLGCVCSGAVSGKSNPRAHVLATEPPRATSPVVEERTPIDLDLPVPVASRTPIEVVVVPVTPSRPVTPPQGEAAVVNRLNLQRPASTNGDARPARLSNSLIPRPVLSAFPLARDPEGKALPRAYVARRRSSPKGVPVIASSDEAAAGTGRERPPETKPEMTERPAEPVIVKPDDPSPVKPPEISSLNPPEIFAAEAPSAKPPKTITQATFATPGSSQELMVSDPAFAGDSARRVVTDFGDHLAQAAEQRPGPRAESHAIREADTSTTTSVPTPWRTAPPAPRSARPVGAGRPPAASPATPPPAALSRGQIVLILIAAIAIAVCASTVVSIIVSRSVAPAASLGSPPAR